MKSTITSGTQENNECRRCHVYDGSGLLLLWRPTKSMSSGRMTMNRMSENLQQITRWFTDCADKQIKCSRRDQARVETTRQWGEREAHVVSVGYSLVRLFRQLGAILITRVGSSSSSSARAAIVHFRFLYDPLDRSRGVLHQRHPWLRMRPQRTTENHVRGNNHEITIRFQIQDEAIRSFANSYGNFASELATKLWDTGCFVQLLRPCGTWYSEVINNDLHIAYFSGCSIFFNNNFETDFEAKSLSVLVCTQKLRCSDSLEPWPPKRARFCSVSKDGNASFTLMSLYCHSEPNCKIGEACCWEFQWHKLWSRGRWGLQTENSKRAHVRAPALQTPPKFHERNPKREKKERKLWREREKSANFGPSTFRGPTFSGFGPHPSRLHPSSLPFGGPPFGVKIIIMVTIMIMITIISITNWPKKNKTLSTFLDLAKVELAKVEIGQSSSKGECSVARIPCGERRRKETTTKRNGRLSPNGSIRWFSDSRSVYVPRNGQREQASRDREHLEILLDSAYAMAENREPRTRGSSKKTVVNNVSRTT